MLNKLRLLTPGPTPLPEEVRLALGRDMIHHRKPEFRQMMLKIQIGLKTLFGTDGPVLPLAASGTGAMTAAAGSLFAPGQRVLVIEAGKFGERWSEICASADLEVVRLKVPWGQAATPALVSEALEREHSVAGVFIQYSETSTGVLNPVDKIAPIVRQSGALFVVDGISAVGISPCPMDCWGIDCLLTGSQKGLLLPPGLALIALSPKAWQAAENTRSRCYYFNLPRERQSLAKGETNFTSPVNLLAGLEASLDLLLAEGLESIYRKQFSLTRLVRAGIEAMGLQPYATTDFTWGLTAVRMPEGIDGQALLKLCQEEFGIVMASGQDNLKGKIIRIGHMGWVDWGDCLAALAAIAQSLNKLGFAAAHDFSAAALPAYSNALAEYR